MTAAAPLIGLIDLSVATGHHVVSLTDLAVATGVDPAKYHVGIGQDEMSLLAPDEDIVTMAATAAAPIIERHGTAKIRTVLFATESGIDQSKAAGVYVHQLLGLPSGCRVVEMKQACYSATAGLQAALGMVARNPDEQVLLIASDNARYDVDSAAEATQGAGAVAMLIGADPTLLAIEPASGVHTADVDDFWRPNDRSTAVVDGRLSVTAYVDSLLGAWDDYQARGGVAAEEIDRFCLHQPFTRMAAKAFAQLSNHTGVSRDDTVISSTFTYNRRIGNSYTASLYFALASVLDNEADVAGRRIGFFSYGSGSVGELFTAVVQPGYRSALRPGSVAAQLDARVPVDVPEYRKIHAAAELASDVDVKTPHVTAAPFRFAGIVGRARRYERNS